MANPSVLMGSSHEEANSITSPRLHDLSADAALLRYHLGIPESANLAQTIEEACKILQLAGELREEPSIVVKAERCLAVLESKIEGHNQRSKTAWGLAVHQEPRRTCLWLVDSPAINNLVLVVILANCVLMAMDVPTGVSPELGIFMERANHFFLGFYTLELLARVVALGLHCEPGGFFSDPFTVFEGSIVVVSWIVLLVPTDTHAVRSMMRCFRSLRMLFVLKEIPGMSELFNTARQCIPSVGNVAGLAFGILLIMGVAGVQFFRGAYHFRCADEGITAYAHSHHLPLRVRGHLQLDDQPAPEGDFSWQQRFDTKGIFCFSQHDRCPKGTVCYEFENNPAGELSFDSTLKATIPVLLTLMIDGWAEQMFNLMDAVGWSAVPYFVIMVTFGGFLVLQLFLAVISDTFVCIEQQRRARGPRKDVVASFFDITDPDGDGLNHVELMNFLRTEGDIYHSFDTNQDGQVSAGELEEGVKKVFKSLDTNQDGRLSRAEIEQGMKKLLSTKELRSTRSSGSVHGGAVLQPGNAPMGGLIKPPRSQSMMAALTKPIEALVTAPYFMYSVNLLVLSNLVIMALPYHNEPIERTRLLEDISNVLSCIFIAEFGLRNVGLGLKRYWGNPWNVVDGSLAVLSIGEFMLQSVASHGLTHGEDPSSFISTIRLLRIVRVVRTIRLAREWPTMYRNILAFVRAIPQVANLLILMCCVVFIFAIVGMQVFGLTNLSARRDSHSHFESFGAAALTVFESFAIDLSDVARACYEAAGLLPTMLYFVPVLVIGKLALMNLFVAILLDAFRNNVGEKESDESEQLQSSLSPRYEPTSIIDEPKADAEAKAKLIGSFDAEAAESGRAGGAESEFDDQRMTLMQRLASQQQKMAGVFSRLLRWTRHPSIDVPLELELLTTDSKMRDTAAAIVSDYRFEIIITFLIVVSTFCLVLDGPRQEPKFLCSDFPTDSSEYDECANATLKPYLEVANVCLTIIFTLEASLKVFAYRRAFFTSRWNLIDFVIVCSSLLSLFPFFSMFQTLRVMRVLRPLRLLIRNPSMKVVIETLVSTIPAVINVQVFVMGLMGIFTLVGMQLFMGTFASCTTRALTTRALCLASEASASTEASLPLPEMMPENRRVLRGSGQRVGSRENIWLNPDEGNFDSFGDSMLTLFIAMTGDNMPRLMWIGMDAEGVDVAPVRKDWSYAAIYFLAWHVVGTFMSLNLFVGAIVETFSKLRKRGDGMALMTPAQQHWTDLLRDVRLMTPISIFRPPTQDSWLARNIRMPLYRLATSRYLEYAAYFVISANLVQLCGDYFRIEENELHHAMYEAFTIMFRIMYLFEFLIKIMGLGVQGYFSSGSRRVEFLLLVATGLECTQDASDALFPPMLLRFLRLVRVLRILRLLGDRRLRRIRELLQTLLLCLPAVMNVASVLFLVMSIYAVLGMQLFPFVKRGKSLNEYSNFESYGRAMLLLFQVLTGDDWYMIMRDAAIDYDHGCNPDAVPSDCGTALAIPFFVSFVLIGAFIFLNLIVAVVLECYDALRAWKDASEVAEQSGKPGFISTDHLIEFQELWAEYAKDNRDDEGFSAIHFKDLPSLVSQLTYPLGLRRKEDEGKVVSYATINFDEAQRLGAAARLSENRASSRNLLASRDLLRTPSANLLASARASSSQSDPVHGRAQEREAIHFCLQIKGLRGKVDSPEWLDFHDTAIALIHHSFTRSDVASPFECIPPEHAGESATFRELERFEAEDARVHAFNERFRRTFVGPSAVERFRRSVVGLSAVSGNNGATTPGRLPRSLFKKPATVGSVSASARASAPAPVVALLISAAADPAKAAEGQASAAVAPTASLASPTKPTPTSRPLSPTNRPVPAMV
jgi:hypothetical protein